MKKLNLLLMVSFTVFASNAVTPLRTLYLKAMQEPTGKNFQLFQKSCKATSELLGFSDDNELLQTLKPKKRHLGAQVHLLVITYKYCTDDKSQGVLEEVFAKESLDKNLKKFISASCLEQLSDEHLKRIISIPGASIGRLKKRLKAITIPGKCSAYKASFENQVNAEPKSP